VGLSYVVERVIVTQFDGVEKWSAWWAGQGIEVVPLPLLSNNQACEITPQRPPELRKNYLTTPTTPISKRHLATYAPENSGVLAYQLSNHSNHHVYDNHQFQRWL